MIKEEWNKQIRQAFIDALEYPLQAIPEFWANRQRETGINKHHFFGFMYKVCSDYLPGMPRVRKDLKNIHPAEPTLFEITDGRADAVQTLDGERTQSLTRDLVLDLEYLITRAAEWYDEKTAYTDLQIVSFAQHAVQFVYKSFQKQGQTKAVMIGVKEYPPDFKGTSKEVLWVDKQVLYRYSFYHQPDALFSYSQFEESLRNLILNSPNPDELKRIMKPLYELGAQIGDLWNDTVQPLEMLMDKEERPHEINEYKVFNAAERDWGTRGKSKEWHYRDEAGFIPLSNYELTLFAVRVSNLVANEVLGKKENALPKETQKTHYKSFDDLFKEEYKTKIEDFIAILRETEKPCINEGYDYNATYRQKAVFFVWFDALVYKQIIHRDVTDRNEIARLLNQKFTGLDVSGSLYSNDSMTNAREVHKDYFEAQITAIKVPIK